MNKGDRNEIKKTREGTKIEKKETGKHEYFSLLVEMLRVDKNQICWVYFVACISFRFECNTVFIATTSSKFWALKQHYFSQIYDH